MTAIRSLLFALYFAVVSVVMTVGCSPLIFIGPRAWVLSAMRLWAGLSLGGLRVIAGTRWELRGHDHVPKGAALIASKHLSMWETLAFHLILHDPAMVMKAELRKVPLYGRYAERARMIIIDREAGMKALRALISEARSRLAEDRQIVIFPEGTRARPGAPPDYKPGIAALYGQLGVPCIPVALNSGLYWPRSGLSRKPGLITIEFLAPIAPGLARDAFMTALESKIETATENLLRSSGAACG